jgi:hypothetical protein
MMRRRYTRRSHTGVSVIEALVAMAVMAFGMLALVGLQGTLRGNSDLSRQRAEAVRIAHQKLEEKRGFSVLSVLSGSKSFDEIVAEPLTEFNEWTGFASSATFRRRVEVNDFPTAGGTPSELDLYSTAGYKQVISAVTWLDRNNELQEVKLSTIVGRIAPEVVGALSVTSGNAPQQTPGGRHRTIPPGAVNLTGDGAGTSIFTPSPTSGVFWKFDNLTGFVVATCTSIAATTCTSVNQRLLWGHIRYSLGSTQPTSREAETPTDSALPAPLTVGVVVHHPSYPTSDAEIAAAEPTICYIDSAVASGGAYYCLIAFDDPVPPTSPLILGTSWAGRVTVTIDNCWDGVRTPALPYEYGFPKVADTSVVPPVLIGPYRCRMALPPATTAPTTDVFANSATDARSDAFRVCRYTSQRGHTAVGAGTPPMRNIDHPLDYVGVTVSLNNQNFLIIRAGDDFNAFSCPDDDPVTPLNGRTYAHQPTTQVP